MSKFMLLVLGAFILVGCSQNIARFSVTTTSNLPITNVKKGAYVEGEDCVTLIFGFPIGNVQNRVSGAVANALEVAQKKGEPADALINVDISEKFLFFFIFGRDCVTAKGQAIGVSK